jgi:hypothetical protein
LDLRIGIDLLRREDPVDVDEPGLHARTPIRGSQPEIGDGILPREERLLRYEPRCTQFGIYGGFGVTAKCAPGVPPKRAGEEQPRRRSFGSW